MSSVSEIESLRSQVAELARELAERDQLLREQRHHGDGELRNLREKAIQFRTIVAKTAEETGDNFFPALATTLTSVLGVQYAVIGKVQQDPGTKKIRTVAVAAGGALVDNFEYDLLDTPCETALASSYACFDRGVQTSFPLFTRLRQLNVEGYCGVSIRAKSGAVIGLLVVMDVKPLGDHDWLRSLLTMFAARAAAELERAWAEDERSQALADLHNILGTIPDILFTLDLQGHLVRWNQTLERVTGYSAKELLNKHALEFVPPAEYGPTASAIQRALQDGYAELEGHLLTKDGRTIPYHWTGARLHDLLGRVIGLTGVGRDITGRKIMERQRQEQAERLHLAMDIADLATWDWNILTNKVIWSENCEQVKRLQPGTFDGTFEAYQRLVHPDDLPILFADINRALAGPDPYRTEHRVMPPGGEIQWVVSNGIVYRNENGEPIRMVGTVHNITERKRTEALLRASEENLRQTLHASNTGLWEWNTETNEVQLSREWKGQLGYEETELPDTFESWKSRLHPDDRARAVAYAQAYIARRDSEYQLEYRLQHKDGTYRWIEARASFCTEPDGRRIRLLGSHIDITDRKRAEQLLETENQVLAMMASSRQLSETLSFLCQSCESLGHGMLASVLLLDQDSQQLRHCAAPSLPEAYTRAIDGVVIGPSVGSCGTAAYWGRQVIVTDIATDPLWGPYSELALSHSLRACWSNPIISDAKEVWGTFALYYKTPRAPMPIDLHLIDRMTNLARFAIERTRGVQALRMSEEKLRQALLASNTGLWDWNTETGEVAFSKEWKSQLGFNEADLPDRFDTWETRLHPDDKLRVMAYVEGYLARPEGEYRLEFRLRHKDGTYRWIEARASFITEPDGQRARLLGSHTDITDRKKAEENLKLFRTLLNQVTDSIEVIDPSTGHFLDGNRQSYESIGYTREELLALTVPDIDPQVTMPIFQERMQHLREVDGPLCVESVHQRKDGTTFPIEVVAQILRHEQEYLVAVVRDITTRKQHESVRLRQYEALQAIFNMTVALSRASSLEEIYERGINGVQGALKVDRASILLFDEDGVMKFKASRGLSKEYIQAVEGHSPWSREAVNPLPIAMQDIEEDPSVEAYRGIFRAEHIRALGFIPLWSSDGLLGKFMLYYDSPHQFTEEEIQVAQTIAGHIAFMIQRKRAEEALRASEERYARATAVGRVGVWQLDVASGEYHGDANLKALLGYGPGELSTDPFAWLGLVHPDDQTIALKAWEQVVSGATDEYHYELRMIRKDGSVIWTHVRGHANRSETGSVVQLIGATVDISERKRADEMLLLTQFSVDRAVDGIFWVAPDARILHVNDAACRMLEYTREELTAMTVHDIDPSFPSESWPAHWEELQQKGSMTFESKHWSRTGRVFETEVTVNYLRYEGKEYNCAIMRDISDRKRTDVALRASEERYRTLYDETPTMYFTLATDGTVRSVNRYGAEQLGYQVEELVGHSVLNVFYEEDKETVAESLSEALATPEITKHWEFRKVRKDGTVLWVRETVRTGQSSSGEIVVLVACEDITERKRAEEMLREMNIALANAMPGIARLDAHGHYLSVNELYASALGYDPSELIGKSWHHTVVEDHRPKAEAAYEIMLKTGKGEFEALAVRKDLSTFWKQVLLVKITNQDDGQLLGHYCFMRDITERREAETLIREAELHYRTIFEQAGAGVARIDSSSGQFGQVNRRYCEIVGLTEAEMLATSFESITHPDDLRGYLDCMARLLRGEIPSFIMEKRYLRKDGSIVWVNLNVAPLWSPGEKPTHHIAIVEDITDRKRAEEELQKSHAFLRQVIDTDPNFIFAKDRDGRFTLVNKATADAYGTTVENLIGKADSDFNSNQEEVAFFRQQDLEVMDSLQERFIPEEKITDANGNVRWLQTVKRPLLDDQGHIIMLLGSSTDITARKRVEEMLRQRERDLRAAVEERERISEDLHDGILQSIYAVGLGLEACKPLISEQPKKSAVKLKAEIQRTIGQLNHVLEEVRNFIAGLESHILDGQEFDVVLRTMVNTLATSYSIPARVTVEKAAAQHLSTEQAYHVMHIAREALSNSLRHSHASRTTLSLKCLRHSVRLSVTDNGVGFNPSTTDGAGHGLSNMASRAKKIGGNFTLRSKPRGGTTVILDLPRRSTDACD